MIKAIIFDWFGVLYDPNKGRNQELFNFMQTLRPAYKIGLLSNGSFDTMNMYLNRQERQQFFDAVVLSGEVGIVKPYPEIFKLVAMRLAVDPAECVFIDDSTDNCRGARLTGMQAIRFVSTEQVIKDSMQQLAPSK